MLDGKSNIVLGITLAKVLKIRHRSSFWVNSGYLSEKNVCHTGDCTTGTEKAARLMRFRGCLYYLTTLTHIP